MAQMHYNLYRVGEIDTTHMKSTCLLLQVEHGEEEKDKYQLEDGRQ